MSDLAAQGNLQQTFWVQTGVTWRVRNLKKSQLTPNKVNIYVEDTSKTDRLHRQEHIADKCFVITLLNNTRSLLHS